MLVKRRTKIFKIEPSKWTGRANDGMREVFSKLTQKTGKQLKITGLNLKTISVSKVPEVIGGTEREVLAVNLDATGAATGQIMLIFPKQVAYWIIDILTNREYGMTRELGETESSTLAEVAGTTGACFIESLDNDLGITLTSTQPQVMIDTLEAILSVSLPNSTKYSDELFMMSTIFLTEGQSIAGSLLLVPSGELTDVLMDHYR